MSDRPVHHLPALAVEGAELCIGQVPVSRLAARVGSTPFYAYDRAQMSARVASLRAALPGGVHLHYAVKANPMPAVVQHLAGQVDGLDVASAGELRVALDSGMAPARVSFAGPGKRDTEIVQAVASGIVINVESERELDVARRASETLGCAARLAVRVNPAFELKASGMQMGGGAKVFGIDAERVPSVIRRIRELGLGFHGLHVYAGSQNLRAEAVIEAQRASIDLAVDIARECGGALETLNVGGGFGIPYFPGEKPLDLAPVGAALADGLHRHREALGTTTIVVELGRYLVGEAGYYVCRVTDRKLSRGQVFLVTDGGLHHHLAASGNFGQVIRKNYPLLVGTGMDRNDRETVDVVGPLCTPLDLLGRRMELPPADVGDLIVVLQSGAYGRTASPLGFLSHPPPPEVLV